MTIEANWITSELKRLFPRADLNVGVDLNGNGTLEPNEKIATFNSNTIPGNKANVVGDWTDWLAFYRHNVAQLARLDQGKSVFAASAKFKPTNPLHTVTVIESGVSTVEKVRKAYAVAATVYAKMKVKNQKAPTPPEKMLDMYEIFREEKISILRQGVHLLLDGVEVHKLDCDTSGFVILAIAHEMRWPLFLARLPNHVFIRWDNGKMGQAQVRFNYDVDGPFTDQHYLKQLNVPAISVSRGVYLTNLDEKKFVSLVLGNRGNVKYFSKRYREAIEDFDEAIKNDPTNLNSYNNRGAAKVELKRYPEALKDCDEVLRLNPNDAEAYGNRGMIKLLLRKYQEALRDLDNAIRINPKYPIAYNSRGHLKYRLGKYHDAIKDYDEAIRLDPGYGIAYQNRGAAKAKLGMLLDARMDYEKAKELEQQP